MKNSVYIRLCVLHCALQCVLQRVAVCVCGLQRIILDENFLNTSYCVNLKNTSLKLFRI